MKRINNYICEKLKITNKTIKSTDTKEFEKLAISFIDIIPNESKWFGTLNYDNEQIGIWFTDGTFAELLIKPEISVKHTGNVPYAFTRERRDTNNLGRLLTRFRDEINDDILEFDVTNNITLYEDSWLITVNSSSHNEKNKFFKEFEAFKQLCKN